MTGGRFEWIVDPCDRHVLWDRETDMPVCHDSGMVSLPARPVEPVSAPGGARSAAERLIPGERPAS